MIYQWMLNVVNGHDQLTHKCNPLAYEYDVSGVWGSLSFLSWVGEHGHLHAKRFPKENIKKELKTGGFWGLPWRNRRRTPVPPRKEITWILPCTQIEDDSDSLGILTIRRFSVFSNTISHHPLILPLIYICVYMVLHRIDRGRVHLKLLLVLWFWWRKKWDLGLPLKK